MLRQRITTFSLTQILERFVASYSKRLFFFKDASAVNVKKTPKEGKICTLDLIFRGLALCNLGDRAYLAFWDMGYLSKKLTGYTEHLVGGGGGGDYRIWDSYGSLMSVRSSPDRAAPAGDIALVGSWTLRHYIHRLYSHGASLDFSPPDV